MLPQGLPCRYLNPRAGRTGLSPQASVPVCLEMDLEQCEIANFEELNSDPESIRLAKASIP
jgi:hypothetical protein